MSWIPVENGYFLNPGTLEIAFSRRPISVVDSLKESCDVKAVEDTLRTLTRLAPSHPILWLDIMTRIGAQVLKVEEDPSVLQELLAQINSKTAETQKASIILEWLLKARNKSCPEGKLPQPLPEEDQHYFVVEYLNNNPITSLMSLLDTLDLSELKSIRTHTALPDLVVATKQTVPVIFSALLEKYQLSEETLLLQNGLIVQNQQQQPQQQQQQQPQQQQQEQQEQQQQLPLEKKKLVKREDSRILKEIQALEDQDETPFQPHQDLQEQQQQQPPPTLSQSEVFNSDIVIDGEDLLINQEEVKLDRLKPKYSSLKRKILEPNEMIRKHKYIKKAKRSILKKEEYDKLKLYQEAMMQKGQVEAGVNAGVIPGLSRGPSSIVKVASEQQKKKNLKQIQLYEMYQQRLEQQKAKQQIQEHYHKQRRLQQEYYSLHHHYLKKKQQSQRLYQSKYQRSSNEKPESIVPAASNVPLVSSDNFQADDLHNTLPPLQQLIERQVTQESSQRHLNRQSAFRRFWNYCSRN